MSYKKLIWMVCLAVILTGAWDARADSGQDLTPAESQPSATATNDFEADAEPVGVPSVSEEILPSLSRIGFSLLIIIAIIYGTVFLLKRLSGQRMGGGARGKTVTVIEQTYIAPKKSVCLLKMADRAVLVGITDTNINLLTECHWDDLPELQKQQIQRSEQGFTQVLTEAAGKLFRSKSAGGGSNETL
ncbi:MAG: flagellar biosynthetic protein FliO [Candidatus Zixiibacteriota bacterium]